MAGNVVEVSDAEFESSIIKNDKPALVDFWAEWCQPCKMLAPTVEEIAGEYVDKVTVAKVNVDDNPQTATKFGIRGIPTILLFKEGKVVQQMVGVKPKGDITIAIDEIL